ncbi:MAG: sigma-70 family RNA polymerase sigma factor [Nibricoccus sp.]
MLSDSELLQRFTQEASQEAFRDLVTRHIDFVYATALRQAGSDARAKDIAQEVFTSLAKKARSLIGRGDLVGWLHTSTCYAAATLRRSEARREQREQKAQAMQENLQPANDPLDWDKLRPLLDDALHELSESDREAILLRYFKQRSFGEIGTTLGLSEEAARKRIDRGVEKLRGILSKRGITSTAVALELAMAGQAAVAAPAGLATSVAATSLAAAAHATTFMSQLLVGVQTAAVIASVVAAVISVSMVVKRVDSARQAERAVTTEQRSVSQLEKDRNQLTRRLAELEQLREAKRQTLTSLKATVGEKIDRLNFKLKGADVVDGLLRLDLDDEMKKLLDATLPILFSSQNLYGPFFARRHYTPEQIDAFFSCFKKRNAPCVPSYKFIDEGQGHGRFNFSLEQKSMDIDESTFGPLFGDADLVEFKKEERLSNIRLQIINTLASSLVYTDAPLDAAASQKLTLILANATPDPASPAPTEIDWEKAFHEAQKVLSPVQLKALARLQGHLSDSTHWNYEF